VPFFLVRWYKRLDPLYTMDSELWSVLPALLVYHKDNTTALPSALKRALAGDMSTNARNTAVIHFAKTVAHMTNQEAAHFRQTASRIRRQVLNSGYQRNARSSKLPQAEPAPKVSSCNQIQMHFATAVAPYTFIHGLTD
jgi:hypothetical protein